MQKIYRISITIIPLLNMNNHLKIILFIIIELMTNTAHCTLQ
uniref:Uncharacterized protein n=1 Tax=Bartonella rochalimae ATCC BAA-1498 TaxID=685782 RepID=E6YJT0_9HYPH|nr:hypothetical protein BARRO_10051 [Bartonella rochalimae ATCC BAA-1498]